MWTLNLVLLGLLAAVSPVSCQEGSPGLCGEVGSGLGRVLLTQTFWAGFLLSFNDPVKLVRRRGPPRAGLSRGNFQR